MRYRNDARRRCFPATVALVLLVCFAWPAMAKPLDADLQIHSVVVDGERIVVDVVNHGDRAGTALVMVTALVGLKPVVQAVEVTVRGQGTASVSVGFSAEVDGVLSTGLTDASDPQ